MCPFSMRRPLGISFVMGDFATASSTMFLLDLGETLEDYTRARSENQLIYSLLGAPENAQLVCGDEEMTVPTANLKAGDLIVVRTGMPVSVNGVVERGVAMVNQFDPDRRAACRRAHGRRRRFRGYRVRRRRDLRPRQGGDGRDEASFHRLAGRAVPKHESRCPDEARALGRPHRALEFPARGRRRPHHAQPRENIGGAYGQLFVRPQAHGVNLGFVRHEPGRQGGLHGEGVEAFRGIRPGRHDRLRQDWHAYRGATPGEMRYRARRMEPDPGPSLRGVLGRALPASRRARRRSRRG